MDLWARRYAGAVSPFSAESRKYLEVDSSEDCELRTLSEEEKELVKGALGTGVQANMTFVETDPGGEDKTGSVPQALSICIQRGAEELAIRLLSQLPGAFPLHLVYRAGEQGLFRLLSTLYDTKTPVSSARLVTRMRLLSRRYQHSSSSNWRVPIQADCGVVTAEELLRWACVSGIAVHIRYFPPRSVLELNLKSETAVSSLLSTGCVDILLELVRKGRIVASPKALLCALEWERLDVVTALQQVPSS